LTIASALRKRCHGERCAERFAGFMMETPCMNEY
jgi:hypothetical protein